jgi:hypothetical protein
MACYFLAGFVTDMDEHVGRTEFAQPLPATAAWCHQRLASANHHGLNHPAPTCQRHCCKRACFGTSAHRIGCVLDIAASMDAAGFIAHRGADGKARIRCIRVSEGGNSGRNEIARSRHHRSLT